jgi:hypothetical protein
MSKHKDETQGSIHTVINKVYTDLTERTADTAYQITANIDKDIRVNEVPPEYYRLTSVGPTVWTPMGSGGGGAGAPSLISEILINNANSATFNTVEDLIDTNFSNGVINGGLLITDGGGGTVDVTGGSVMIRSTDSEIGTLFSVDVVAVTGLPLTDDITNFVFVDWNAGAPVISASFIPLNPNTSTLIGFVTRVGPDVHITNANTPTAQFNQTATKRFAMVDGLTRQAGSVISESGVRNIAVTSGIWWLAFNEISLVALDTSVADDYIYYYGDGVGGHTKIIASTQIDNTQYDDGSGTLATLINNRYGVHWVYQETDGALAVVYGTGNYLLSEADAASPPLDIPPQLTNFHAALIGKIIIKKNDATFTEIQNPFAESFGTTSIQTHLDLADIGTNTHAEIDTFIALAGGGGTASHLILDDIGTTTHDEIDTFINTTVPAEYVRNDSEFATYVTSVSGAGILSVATITDNADGTIAVDAFTVGLRETDSPTGIVHTLSIGATASVTLTDAVLNFIYVEYNAGVPQLVADTTLRTDTQTNALIGEVFRDGISLHIDTTSQATVANFISESLNYLEDVFGFSHASGAFMSETGIRNFAITAGIFWRKLNKFNSPPIDTSVADTFSYFYQDGLGGWTEVLAQTQINNLQYDDGTGTLANLSTKRYGVHYVYGETDGRISVVYGTDNYKLVDAEASQPPSNVPPSISNIAVLVGKIIIEQASINFTDVQSAFVIPFTESGVVSHIDLIDIGTTTHNQIDQQITLTGTGSPEGVVTAVVGRLYTDSAGGVGTTLYVKEVGTGNTGWSAK